MALASAGQNGGEPAGRLVLARVAASGSGAHPYVTGDVLAKGPHAWRNLADAVHFLCALHGRHPGVIDHAADRIVDPEPRKWLAHTIGAFAAERALLTRLAAAAGPIPSTPGSGDTEGAVVNQRHAIEMLARSERNGCSLGAALALVADWRAIRPVLEVAAQRFGVEPRPCALSEPREVAALADAAAAVPAVGRAMLFGAEQIALQHHGLWDLLEARQQARGDN